MEEAPILRDEARMVMVLDGPGRRAAPPSDLTYHPCYRLRRGPALGHGAAYATRRYLVVHFARNS